MRDDFSRAAAALRTLSSAIDDCPAGHKERLTAYVIKLGRLVRDNPIISAAVAELEQREQADEELLALRIRVVTTMASETFARFAASARGPGPLQESSYKAIWQRDSTQGRNTEPKKLRDMIAAASAGQTLTFTLADIHTFRNNAVRMMQEGLQPHEARDPEVSTVLGILDDFIAIANAAEEVEALNELMKRLSVGRVIARLRMFARAWESLLRNEGPAPTGPRSVRLDGIENDIPGVVEFLVAQLEAGVARRFALHRLRVLFEQFDYDDLRAELQAAESAGQSRERILQEEMDRFLFQEGYFPVTHAAASRGYFDTLLLEHAEASGVPPLLIELKQVVAFAKPGDASRAAVAEAIGSARGEVQRYRGHVATRPQWAGLLPVIVVVHSCVEDVSDLEASDVVLIDLSPTTPSRKRPRRFEPPEETGAAASAGSGSTASGPPPTPSA